MPFKETVFLREDMAVKILSYGKIEWLNYFILIKQKSDENTFKQVCLRGKKIFIAGKILNCGLLYYRKDTVD